MHRATSQFEFQQFVKVQQFPPPKFYFFVSLKKVFIETEVIEKLCKKRGFTLTHS